MTNRYCNLGADQEIKDSFNGINTGFDGVQGDIDEHVADSVTDANGVHGFKIESGLWTPAYDLSGFTYTSQFGSYVKIGPLVKCIFRIITSASPASGGVYAITGLPFVANLGNINGGSIGRMDNISLQSGRTQLMLSMGPIRNALSIASCGLGVSAIDNVPATSFGVNANLWGEISYIV